MSGRVRDLQILIPDLEPAIETFVSCFGYTLADRGEVSRGEDGRQLRTARLTLRNGPDAVLWQLDSSDGAPLLSRWGLDSHLCWYVDEIEPAVAFLRERGIAVENKIFDRFGQESGPESTYIHFDTPWGMDAELISNPRPVAYEAEEDWRLWHPNRSETWGEGDDSEPVDPPAHGMPTNRGTCHMGMRVPDLDQAIDFFAESLDCAPLFRHSPLQRSGGRWTEISPVGEPPEPDRSVPDERFPHGTRIRVAFLRCANFNFEPMELMIPDDEGTLRPVYDAEAARIMCPVWAVDSVAATAAELVRAGARDDDLVPGADRYLAPWGQAIGLVEG